MCHFYGRLNAKCEKIIKGRSIDRSVTMRLIVLGIVPDPDIVRKYIQALIMDKYSQKLNICYGNHLYFIESI